MSARLFKIVAVSVVSVILSLFASQSVTAQTVKIRDLPQAPSPTLLDFIPEANVTGTPTTYKVTPNALLAQRNVTCTPPLLCNSTTSANLGADVVLSLSPYYLPLAGGTMTGNIAMGSNNITMAGTYTSTSNGAPFHLLATSSTSIGATNEGLRTALMNLTDTNTSSVDDAVMMIDSIQTSNAGAACIKRTGLHVKTYTMPDNGCDTSSILAVQSGGGSGISVYKLHTLRPTGYTDYSSSIQGAIEAGTNDQSQAGLFMSGINIGGATTNSSTAILARIDNATSRAIVVQPNDNTFDTRDALILGVAQINATPVNQTFDLKLNGQTTTLGKMGIGSLSTPDSSLVVTNNVSTLPTPITGTVAHFANSDSSATRMSMQSFANSAVIDFVRADGTAGSMSGIGGSQEVVGAINLFGHDTSSITSTGRLFVQWLTDGTWSPTSTPTAWRIGTTPSGSTTARVALTVDNAGHLSCGGGVPTVACTGTGTSPTAPSIDSGGTDCKFKVLMNTGTGSPGSTGTCTVTFGTAYVTNNPVIVCSLVKGATAWGNGATIQQTTESLTAPVFTWTNLVGGVATALTTSTSYKISCIALQ